MSSFFEKLRDQFDQFRDNLDGEEQNRRRVYELQDHALIQGAKCIVGNEVQAFEPGTVAFINEQSNEIDIWMEDGSGYVLRFPLVKIGYQLEVRPHESVQTGTCLVRLEAGLAQAGVQVYAFDNETLKALNHACGDQDLGFPGCGRL